MATLAIITARGGQAVYNTPEFANCRSQDLEPVYHDCGQFYFLKTKAFQETKTVIGNDTAPYIMPEELVQDIDDPSDWKIAEMKYRIMQETAK